MLKTPEQIQEEIKKSFQEVKDNWTKYLEWVKDPTKGETPNYTLYFRQKVNPQIPENVQKTSILIEDALKKNSLEGWEELYGKWNSGSDEWDGNSDISKDKYNSKQDLCGKLSDLRLYLESWEKATREQSQQEQLKETQRIIKLLQNKLTSESGKNSWKELEAKIEVLKNKKS